MPKRKRKKKISKLLVELQAIIKDKNHLINCPKLKPNLLLPNGQIIPNHFSHTNFYGSDLDFTIHNYPNIILNSNNKLQTDKLNTTSDGKQCTTKFQLYPTPEQKTILIKYADAHIDMYNNVVQLIKNKRKEESQLKGNINLRYCDMEYNPTNTELKKYFANIKNIIGKKYNVNLHILDYAITDCIGAFQSAKTNQIRGNIRMCKLRYLKKSKPIKIFKVEKEICTENSFCNSVLGKNLKIIPKLNYKLDCKKVHIIQYNSKTGTFLLLKRDPLKQITFKAPNKVIAIDPGERTLVTGISENHILEIGTNISNKIENKLKKMQQIINRKGNPVKKILKNGDEITEKIPYARLKRKIESIQKGINNYVTDTHWKVANYLTMNYEHIVIGNLSTSHMKKQDKSNNLEILKNLNMFMFRERIKYKCLERKRKYKRVNEAYTTKCCVKCGTVTEIGRSKIYECKNCKRIHDRDVKSAGCIYLKALE